MPLDYNGYNQLVIVSRRVNGATSVLEMSGLLAELTPVPFPSDVFMRLIVSFSTFLSLFCTRREMDRLGILTASHQDIITASLQQEMLSQMQHMQHTMVPV